MCEFLGMKLFLHGTQNATGVVMGTSKRKHIQKPMCKELGVETAWFMASMPVRAP